MTEKWNLWLCSLPCFTSLVITCNLWLRSLLSFTSLLLKWNLWLHSLHCLNPLSLKWNLWLCSLRCFTSLLLTRGIALLSLRCSFPSRIFLPRNFNVSIKFICATVISSWGSSVESYVLYYPFFYFSVGEKKGYKWWKRSIKGFLSFSLFYLTLTSILPRINKFTRKIRKRRKKLTCLIFRFRLNDKIRLFCSPELY